MKHFHILSIVTSIALAACGGKTKGDTTPPGGGGTEPDAAPVTGETTPDAAPAEPEPDPHEALMAAETSAWDSAKPVIDKYCGGCHVEGGAKATEKKLEHINFTRYPIESHHTDTLTATIGHVLGVDGAKPTMPKDKPGSVKGDELALIEAWIEAYNAAEDGGAHAEHEHDDGHADHHHDD